jgi:hypothetical protein
MSVLSFPRVYFKGLVGWDPATGNNNDYLVTYDGASTTLNWEYLASMGFAPGTLANGDTKAWGATVRSWMSSVQTINDVQSVNGVPTMVPTTFVPAEWNYFGGNAAQFVQYADNATAVVGGTDRQGRYVADDPIVGRPVTLSGDVLRQPARLVDANPFSTFTSQIFFGSFTIGAEGARVSGPRVLRMFTRWLNFGRNLAPNVRSAGVGAATFQTCLAKADLHFDNAAGSPLLRELADAMGDPRVKGLMIRLCSYFTMYDMNGVFNNVYPRLSNDGGSFYPELSKHYQAALAGDEPFFSNPAYSRIVGVAGLWTDEELMSVPTERFLVPDAAVPYDGRVGGAVGRPYAKAPGAQQAAAAPASAPSGSVTLGVASALVHTDASGKPWLGLDFNTTIPEIDYLSKDGAYSPSEGAKADFGPLTVQAIPPAGAGGEAVTLATVEPAQYGKTAYERSGGIVDVPLDPAKLPPWLAQGTLAVLATSNATALSEAPLNAQIDARDTYVVAGQTVKLPIRVYDRGLPASSGRVQVTLYQQALLGAQNNPLLVPQDGVLRGPDGSETPLAAVVTFLNGERKAVTSAPSSKQVLVPEGSLAQGTVVLAEAVELPVADGVATLELRADRPGFPMLYFQPFADGATPDAPSPLLFDYMTTGYATLRVLPTDERLLQELCAKWNVGVDEVNAGKLTKEKLEEEVWRFLYTRIFYLYDVLFPVMRRYFDFGDRSTVEDNIATIMRLTSEDLSADSTVYMPVTRDLSPGRRAAIHLWGQLVLDGYPLRHITPEPIAARP